MASSVTKPQNKSSTGPTNRSTRTKIKLAPNSDINVSPRSEHVSPNLWDSLESDTESLVQEKAYQRELQRRILDEANDKDPHVVNLQKNSVNVDMKRSEYEDCSDSYSSREARRPGPPDNNTNTRQNRDEYADLRYDPDWRQNLAGAQFLCQVQTSLSLDSSYESGESVRHAEDVDARRRHEYTVVSNAESAEVDIVQPSPPSTSFHLHPQQSQSSHEEPVLSVPQSPYMSSENTPSLTAERALKPRDRFTDHQSVVEISPPSSTRQRRHRDNMQFDKDDQISSTSQEESKHKLNYRRPRKVRTRPREDIVERNKATLGMNTHKQGSYLKAYGQKEKKQHETNEPSDDTASIDSEGSPDNALDPELMWIQKTQKLKVHKESKRSDGPRHYLRKPKPKIHLNPPVDRHVLETDQQRQCSPRKQMDTPSDSGRVSHPSSHQSIPSAPTVNLNINLNSPAQCAEPFLGSELQKHVYTFPPPSLQWRFSPGLSSPPIIHPGYSVHQVPSALQEHVSLLSPGGLHVSRNYLQGTGGRTNDEPIIKAQESNSVRIAQNWQLFEENHGLNIPELVLFDDKGVDSTHARQTYSGGYAVLPPISRSNTSDTELCSDRMEPAPNALQRSSSEGYLAQLEKQRQLKANITYKAYTLKDYRGLNPEVKLGGLGPSNAVAENVAEKIRRQKLYSNVIREQNKKISRIPFLPTRNLVGSDNKDIPRNKALEYAKTIVKPKPQQQWREKPIEESEHDSISKDSAYLQLGVDFSQLATLEMLRKRHEQEKQVVARFTSLHTAS